MNCRDAEKKIVLSLSGDLDPQEQGAIEEHLKNCPVCSRKYEEIERDINWMARISGQEPKLDWDTSWPDIRKRAKGILLARQRRVLLMRRLMPTAAAGVILLAFLIGRFVLFSPGAGSALQPIPPGMTSRLVQKYMEEVGMVLLEYMNREFSTTNQPILAVEKEKARFLLFQNRNLRALLAHSKNPVVIPLLNDLEMVLYETANFGEGDSRSHEFIKTMIEEKEIFFRMRFVEQHLGSNKEKAANI
jgi:hypothetical protein